MRKPSPRGIKWAKEKGLSVIGFLIFSGVVVFTFIVIRPRSRLQLDQLWESAHLLY